MKKNIIKIALFVLGLGLFLQIEANNKNLFTVLFRVLDEDEDKEENRLLLQSIRTCSDTSTLTIYSFIKEMASVFPKGYGAIAMDSINVVTDRFNQLEAKGQLIVSSNLITYTPDTTSFKTWLKLVFKGAKTTADSINLLSKWIPANFPEGEANMNVEELSVEDFYNLIRDGVVYGDCYNYNMFMLKLVQKFQDKWGWGIPISMDGDPRQTIHGSGKQPMHTWLGFINAKGEIWCIADPTIGGIVKDKKTGTTMSYDDIMKNIWHPIKSYDIYIEPLRESLQATGPCVFSPNLRSTKGLVSYKPTPNAECLTRGDFYTYLEEGCPGASMVAPYWKAEKYPRLVVYNIFAQCSFAVVYSKNKSVEKQIAKKYGIVVGER